MSKEFIFNFCIIPNPFAGGSRNIIFISKSGEKFLDKKIVDSKSYQDVKEILEQFGYTETEHLQFESSNSISCDSVTITDMKLFLEDFGLKYSRELEVNIIKDLSNIKPVIHKQLEELPINEKTKNKLIESKSELFDFKYKEPKVREKVTLYFYLFLEFGFNVYGKPIIQFGGDFKDSNDYDDRNYIKIVKSEFERVSDPGKPNSIILRSCKTQRDFIKEAGMLYSGYFRYQKKEENGDSVIIREQKHIYKLLEVKKFLNPEQAIIIETSRMGYDKLVNLSKKIKTESKIEANKFISIEEIEKKSEDIKSHLLKNMNILSELEDFESAAKIKKDVDFLNEKVDLIKTMKKPEISTEEYFKLFYIT